MNKILLIIHREYLTRIRKKSFLIMTILGPLLFALITILPVYLTTQAKQSKEILVSDACHCLEGRLISNNFYNFIYTDDNFALAQTNFSKSNMNALLFIPDDFNNTGKVTLFTNTQFGIGDKSYLEQTLSKQLAEVRLNKAGIDSSLIKKIYQPVQMDMQSMNDEQANTNITASSAAGIISAILVYLFIFMYGVQVMRGVIEEKTNRIIEVIISSVKPFQLMMGKIIGIGLVSLTQFVLWLLLTLSISTYISSRFQLDRFNSQNIDNTLKQIPDTKQAMEMHKMVSVFESINFGLLVPAFMFYFLMGYLLYSSMFAAVGSAIDSESDNQQFMLPITIPLIFSFVVATTVMENPDSPLAVWLSIIPLTSPIIMMVRIPFGVPTSQLILSMTILVISFLFFVWLAGRIYRVGILMYGKKPSYAELVKWIFYK